jgi:hypothetical protein
MKVAALSAAISWLLVGVFISVCCTKSLDRFNFLRVTFGRSMDARRTRNIPGGLVIRTGILRRRRFLVSGLGSAFR